jgi:uncharacterized protein YciI
MDPPRPTFATDMTAAEATVMKAHVAYWQAHLDAGRVVVFGPVADPSGTWGLAVLEVDTEDDAVALADADPTIREGVCTYEVFPMQSSRVRR